MLTRILRVVFGLCALAVMPLTAAAQDQCPNILFVSVDDMSCDSVGAYGCKLPDTTPHMDQFARESLRFEHAHVQVGNCMPSRNVMFSGRYPHNNRVEGFYQIKNPQYPVLCELMKDSGYFVAIRGKVAHSTPYSPFAWDAVLDTIAEQKLSPKSVESYYTSTLAGIKAGQEAVKPFCLLINISDPHKPFYGVGKGNKPVNDPNKPSRIFTADEVPVPKFLPATPQIRAEVAQYYSTVRRADDCFGATMRALEESGTAKNTLVMFLSDHGMPLPFAKTQLYHHSTHTPWMVRWPGVTKADSIDQQHMISAVDLLPTLLDVAAARHPDGIEGRSFLPLIKGETQSGRDFVFKEYNENSGAGRHPMRSVQSKRFIYIYNPWSNGERVFKTATTGTASYRQMKQLAPSDSDIAARLELFDHRVPEEFYDVENDPDALNNLIDDPEYLPEINRFRQQLMQWMKTTDDHALEAFAHREDPKAVEAYVSRVQQEATQRRAARRKKQNQPPNRQQNRPRSQRRGLISFAESGPLTLGASSEITVRHQLPADLKTQKLHVTLKAGDNQRIERKVIEVQGSGEAKVQFQVPLQVAGNRVIIAAFVGQDFQSCLQHISTQVAVAQKE